MTPVKFTLPADYEPHSSFVETFLDRLASETAVAWKLTDSSPTECDWSSAESFYVLAASIQSAVAKVQEISRGRTDGGAWQLAVSQDNADYLNLSTPFGLTVKDWLLRFSPGINVVVDPSVSRRAEISWFSPERSTFISVPVPIEPL